MASSEIDKLKEQLAAEINKKKLAAEHGLSLLQEKESLKVSLQKQETKYEKTLSEHLQQIHSLTVKLDTKEHEVKLLTGELELSKESFEKQKMKLAHNDSELHHQLVTLKKERNHLEFGSIEKDAEIEALKKTIGELEEQLKEAVSSSCTSYSENTNSFEQNVLNENQALQKVKSELEEELTKMEKEMVVMKQQEERTSNDLQVIQEELAYSESKLAECIAHKHRLQEENEELQSEIEKLKLGDVDLKRRGNSLFGEVEDNRKALENEVKSLRSQKQDLIQRDEQNEQEIKKMKSQITMLLSMCDQKANTKYVQSLTQDLLKARGEVEELTAKLKICKDKQGTFERSNIPSPVERTSDRNSQGYEFMNVLIDEKDKKIQALTSELESVSMTKTILNNRVIHAERQLYQAEQQNSNLRAEVMRFKLEMENRKKDTSKLTKPSLPVIKVEKIPGFLEKSNTIRMRELVNNSEKILEQIDSPTKDKENTSPQDAQVRKFEEGKKKVRFVLEEPEADVSKQCMKSTKVPGKKVNVCYTPMTSEDAVKPEQCKQQ